MTCPYTNSKALALPIPLTVLSAAATSDAEAMRRFYEGLRNQPALHLDADSNCWIAARPELAQAALLHPDLGVRPPGQAIPPGLLGRAFGSVFGLWLRMRDDTPREAEKQALQEALASQEAAELEAAAEHQARLALTLSWAHWQWASLPCTVAALLGLDLSSTAAQQGLLDGLAAMALALKPAAQEADLAQSDLAVEALLTQLTSAPPGSLAQALQAQAHKFPMSDSSWWPAQALALLWQSYEAGAGLLGQGLLQGAEPQQNPMPTELGACPAPVATRFKALRLQAGAIHHTRRFALRDCSLGGQGLRQGEAVLVILAGHEAVTDETLGFGLGRHRCPGEAMALSIGARALQVALSPTRQRPLPECLGFEPLANARVPKLIEAVGAAAGCSQAAFRP